MTARALAAASLRRIGRDRTTLFFLVVLPVLVILILGMTLGGFSEFRVGVVDEGSGALGREVAARLDRSPTLALHRYSNLDRARAALRRAEVDSVVVLPAGMDGNLRAGRSVEIPVLGERTNSTTRAARSAVESVVAQHASGVQAAVFVTAELGGAFDANLARARAVAARTAPLTVREQPVEKESRFLPEGFSYSAPTMLTLFVFINALAAGAAIIQTRDLGIYARMLAAPVRPRQIVTGETMSYLLIALLQSALILVVGALVFGVDWGAVTAVVPLVVVWALVGTGAGMLSGTLFRTPEQATSIGPSLGIAFGMLGGCMWPLAIVGPAMKVVGHAVPHAWAIDAWIVILSRGGGLADVARQLLVLAAFAAGLLVVASIRLRARLVA